MSIKVSIVEDDTVFRESMAILINGSEGFRCLGAYPHAEVPLTELPKSWPDVLLMDINLPKMSGIDCVAKLKAQYSAVQIIMLTAYMDSEQIFNSLKAGASGYLLKKTPPAKILESIEEAHAGGAPMSNVIARRVVQFFQAAEPKTAASATEVEALSTREMEILNCLAKGQRYKEIGDELSISPLTVRSHIRRIYDKLHVRSCSEAVLKAFGTGR